MKKWQRIVGVFGRVFVSLFFILSAINKIIEWKKTESGLTDLLCDWQSYASFSLGFQKIFSVMLDWTPALLVFLILIELIGGLLVFFGIKVRLGSFLLLLFLIITTFLFHHFWFLTGVKREFQLILFLKNIAMMGGLFYVFAFSEKPKKTKINIPLRSPDPIPQNKDKDSCK
jgi:uncharacterized membrane protein YphA (DoxX/SURF4 family)